jgi:hypothetical protein
MMIAMKLRPITGMFIAAVVCGSGVAEDDLPKRKLGEMLDIEPKLMLNDPDFPLGFVEPVDVRPDVERLEVELERAQKSAAAGERLFKAGILAKVEWEKRTLKAKRLTSELEAARARAAAEHVASLRKKLAAREVVQAEVEKSEADLSAASERATQALQNFQRAQLEAAELNLTRQRQLLAAGAGRKSLVQRAEEQLAALKKSTESQR